MQLLSSHVRLVDTFTPIGQDFLKQLETLNDNNSCGLQAVDNFTEHSVAVAKKGMPRSTLSETFLLWGMFR